MGEGIIGTRTMADVDEGVAPSQIAFACVVWRDPDRLRTLLTYVRPYFTKLYVAVQESDDGTLEVAQELADVVVTDEHRGYGDATFGPKLLPRVSEPWTFKVDVDELPSEDLLTSLPYAVRAAELANVHGVWVQFKSSIDGVYWNEQHAHLRLFRTHMGWPSTLHSRPPIQRSILWDVGYIDHARTLDEMMQDYLRYYRIGQGNVGWDNHNRLMMRSACLGAAKERGWNYVRQFSWWPEVRDAAFQGDMPMIVFCAGPSCNGTRMLYDKVGELGLKVVHASLPGYYDNPKPGGLHFDVENPIWWSQADLENTANGEFRWVIITRKPEYAALSAVARGFVPSASDYPEFRQRALDTLDQIDGAYRLSYEDFVADPQGEYDKLADWLGVARRKVSAVFDANAKYVLEEPTVEEPAPVEQPPAEAPTRRTASRRSGLRSRAK